LNTLIDRVHNTSSGVDADVASLTKSNNLNTVVTGRGQRRRRLDADIPRCADGVDMDAIANSLHRPDLDLHITLGEIRADIDATVSGGDSASGDADVASAEAVEDLNTIVCSGQVARCDRDDAVGVAVGSDLDRVVAARVHTIRSHGDVALAAT